MRPAYPGDPPDYLARSRRCRWLSGEDGSGPVISDLLSEPRAIDPETVVLQLDDQVRRAVNSEGLARVSTHVTSPATQGAHRPGGGPPAAGAGHIASLMPRRMSQTFVGHAVANPIAIPTCIRNQ